MNDWVQETRENRMASRLEFRCIPCEYHHAGVMVQMQEWNLILFFAQHKEHSVQQIGHLQ